MRNLMKLRLISISIAAMVLACSVNRPNVQLSCLQKNQRTGTFEYRAGSIGHLPLYLTLQDTIGYLRRWQNDTTCWDTLRPISGREDLECYEPLQPVYIMEADEDNFEKPIQKEEKCKEQCTYLFAGKRALVYEHKGKLQISVLSNYHRGAYIYELESIRKK